MNARIVYDVAADWGASMAARGATTNKAIDLLVRNLAGLTATDAHRLAYKAINEAESYSESEMPEVMRAKYELLGRDSPLSFEYETAQFAEIGGMHRLRQWLELRRSFFIGPEAPENLDRRAVCCCWCAGLRQEPGCQSAAGIHGCRCCARFRRAL